MGISAGLWGCKKNNDKNIMDRESGLDAFFKVTVEAVTPKNYKQCIKKSRDQTILIFRQK